jgi:hypothetical protein
MHNLETANSSSKERQRLHAASLRSPAKNMAKPRRLDFEDIAKIVSQGDDPMTSTA